MNLLVLPQFNARRISQLLITIIVALCVAGSLPDAAYGQFARQLLKDCVKGQETIIKLKRRKYQIVLPQPPLGSSLLLNNSAIMSASSPGFNLPPNNGNVNTPSLHDSLNGLYALLLLLKLS